jgi:hypothetical protein
MTNCAYLGASHQCAEEIFASTVIEHSSEKDHVFRLKVTGGSG